MIAPKTYIPVFPYKGDQVLVSSGRLVFHAKDDSAFVFAKESISLSTSGSVHVNAPNNVHINSNNIQLGLNAQERVIKGDMAINDLRILYTALNRFTVAVGSLSETELESAIVQIHTAAVVLSETLTNLQNRLPELLSNTTKTA